MRSVATHAALILERHNGARMKLPSIFTTAILCLCASHTVFANASQPSVAPPHGVGLFIYNPSLDIAGAASDEPNNPGKTNITKNYSLSPNVNWYVYPDVLQLDCGESGVTITQAANWPDVVKYYKTNWLPDQSTHHIYLLPTLDIDLKTCNTTNSTWITSVSYTHLTLPTILRV